MRQTVGVDRGIGRAESSAEFARTRHWAREMAHKHTTRGDGYERWDFKDGSALIRQANGLLVARDA